MTGAFVLLSDTQKASISAEIENLHASTALLLDLTNALKRTEERFVPILERTILPDLIGEWIKPTRKLLPALKEVVDAMNGVKKISPVVFERKIQLIRHCGEELQQALDAVNDKEIKPKILADSFSRLRPTFEHLISEIQTSGERISAELKISKRAAER